MVTVSPIQNGFREAVTVMLTGRAGFTPMTTGLLVTGFTMVQLSDDSRVQVTISPFEGVQE